MRALRSRSVKSDSASSKSDKEKDTKKIKHNKKTKKTSKRKSKVSTDISTESDILTKSSEETHKNEDPNESKLLPKSKRVTRHSTYITKDVLKENISPKINENVSETDVFEKSPQNPRKSKKKNRRNERRTSDESLEFKNVVTSTAKKPKKTRKSKILNTSKSTTSDDREPQNKTRVSRKLSSANKSQNFDVTLIKDESKSIRNMTKSTLSSSTFEISHSAQEYSPTFKNIITSTTIKPKKRKQSNENQTKNNTSKEAMEIDVNDNKSSNILLKNDIINISDVIGTNTIKSEKNVTDVLNSTYLKMDDDDNPSVLSTNNSGEWNIEEQKSIINISDDTKMFESNSNKDTFTSPVDANKDMKKVLFLDKSLSKSARKKWQRFPRNSQGANSILEQISTPHKKSPPNKLLNMSQKLNKTGNTSITTAQSTSKIKRTAMPNFALIHQKAYDKMESITEYSQRKKDRANLLLSNKKVETKENVTSENKFKSSRNLFTNEKPDTSKMKFNRFGFKVKPNTTTIKPPEKPLKQQTTNTLKSLKPSIYDRGEVLAIANKKVQNTGKLRETKRDLLKGVRTNRRFELLMKMRNN